MSNEPSWLNVDPNSRAPARLKGNRLANYRDEDILYVILREDAPEDSSSWTEEQWRVFQRCVEAGLGARWEDVIHIAAEEARE